MTQGAGTGLAKKVTTSVVYNPLRKEPLSVRPRCHSDIPRRQGYR